jgi:hypothetical protein
MKKPAIFLISFFIVNISLAQRDIKYIFNSKPEIEYNFFLGPECKVGPMIDGVHVYSGLKAGMILNNKIAVGLSGGGILSSIGYKDYVEDTHLKAIVVCGGFFFDIIIPSRFPVQISFPNLLGISGVTFFSNGIDSRNRDDLELLEGGTFFIYEPAINLEINIIKFMRIGLGGGYRLALGEDMDRLLAQELSDITFNINLKFGSF